MQRRLQMKCYFVHNKGMSTHHLAGKSIAQAYQTGKTDNTEASDAY